MIQADTNPVSPLQPGTLLSLIEPTLNSAKPEVLNFKVGGQWRHLSASEISARPATIPRLQHKVLTKRELDCPRGPIG